MNRDRFRFFQSVHHESDLLIGVRHRDFSRTMVKTALVEQTRLRKLLMDHIKSSPSFGTSLEPLPYPSSRENTLDAPHLPDEILTMLRSAQQTATGPMSSVAGLFAEKVGRRLIGAYGLDEIVVENGGDLFVKNSSDLVSVIHAGTSNLSDKMAFVITPGKWGICTSSGTIGHSFSRGKA
ncbi:MAG: UPF0280 family protein, partial [Bacteroidales bacterium]|nr:UPF0280 family protein [Bacteroidales bacterium]